MSLVFSQPIKAVDAVRRLECDTHARFGHDGVKVASSWMLHRVPAIRLGLERLSHAANVS